MSTRYNYTGGLITEGLVLNLDAAKRDSYPGSGTLWRDLSGNGNNGTLTNGPTFSGIGKQASIVFDGVDDYVKSTAVNGTGIMNPTLYGEVISVNIWSRSTSTRGSQYVITTGAYTGVVTGFTFIVNDGGTSGTDFIGIRTSTKAYVYSSNFVSLNEWVNACFTTDGTNMYIYKNGILIGTILGVSVGSGESNNAGLQISGPNNTSGFLFVGRIPITQIYNRALSAAEVLQNFNALKGRYGIA
jgi:hypothetical protein